jgi:hypothetical protein
MSESNSEESPQNDQMRAESGLMADIILRILANRPLPVCLESLLTVLYSISEQVSPDAKAWMSQQIGRLSKDISSDLVEAEAAISH